MTWNVETDWLMRLIALLFSLADAGEYASRSSRRVRVRVLAILRPAEEEAFREVADLARHYGAPIPAMAMAAYADWATAVHGDSAEDAARLAERLRAMALALSFIVAWAGYFARRLCAIAHTRQLGLPFSPAKGSVAHDAAAPPWPDTS